MSHAQTLARELEAVVAAVPGVVMLYPPQSSPVVAVISIVSQVARSEMPPLVAVSGDVSEKPGVEDTDVRAPEQAVGGLSVAVTIGVSESVSAAETCRAVYSAIVEHLAASGHAPARTVSVLVGAIT